MSPDFEKAPMLSNMEIGPDQLETEVVRSPYIGIYELGVSMKREDAFHALVVGIPGERGFYYALTLDSLLSLRETFDKLIATKLREQAEVAH